MSEDEESGGRETPTPSRSLAIARIAIGLVQGIAVAALNLAVQGEKAWPATDGLIFAPLQVAAIFVPVVVILSLGNLRPRTFTIWVLAATALCASLGYYDILRDPDDYALPRIIPSNVLWLALGGGLFIAHSMIVAGDADRRFIATYPRYFEVAWKHGVQLVFAACFGIFWAVLIQSDPFRVSSVWPFVRKIEFTIPIATLAFAYVLHVTDAHATIIRAVQALALTLLSRLLHIVALLAVAIVLALPFAGFEIHRGLTGILLATAAALVFLINTTYPDLRSASPASTALRYSSSLVVAIVVLLVALAAYGLTLRVQQYGWSPQRIIASACIAVGACFALGYALAMAWPKARLSTFEATNIITAFIMLGAILALLTPIADPARLSVADQVARLESGRTPPERFDFAFLRFGSGRYGVEALARLSQEQDGSDAARIAELANVAMSWRTRDQIRVTPQVRLANITVVHPKGQSLPMSFLQQDWGAHPQRGALPFCLLQNFKCEAILADLDDDGNAEVLLYAPFGPASAFKVTADERWVIVGQMSNLGCAGVREALRDGNFQLSQAVLKELAVNQQRLPIVPSCQ